MDKYNNYLIKSAQVGADEGGIACGPCGGFVVAEICVADKDGNEFYLSNGDIEGFPNMCKSTEPLIGIILDMDAPDKEVEKVNNAHIDVGEDYCDIWEDKENEDYLLLKYLVYLTLGDEDDIKDFIEDTTGKWLSEIEIPICDLEAEYLEDEEDEDE